MFSGIVSDIGEITEISEVSKGRRITIACNLNPQDLKLGASVCCSGICLTVTETQNEAKSKRKLFSVDASDETLSLTPAKWWKVGDNINLEESLRLGSEIGGHLVFGHVDGLAQVINITPSGNATNITLNTSDSLINMLATKGSVAIDGVSLTINQITNNNFTITIIPHTSKHTTLGQLKPNNHCAIEIDMLMRYAKRILQTQ